MAPFVHVNAAGSSALFQSLEIAAVNDIAPTMAACVNGVLDPPATVAGPGVCTIHHYSIETSDCPTCAALKDSRSSGTSVPALQTGSFWVVWVASSTTGLATDIWSDVSVDSTVGVRSILARGSNPNGGAVTLVLDRGTEGVGGMPHPSDNASTPSLMLYGTGSVGGTGYAGGAGCGDVTPGCDDEYIAADVYAALANPPGNQLTAGLTDIRAEDARFATERINKPLDTAGYFSGLCDAGLGPCGGGLLIGQSILSGTGTSTAFVQPVNFGLPGFKDPFNGQTVPTTFTTISIGESPILFLTNRANTDGGGLGTLDPNGHPYYSGVWASVLNSANLASKADPGYITKLGKLFEGKDCTGDAAAFSNAGGLIPAPPTTGWPATTVQVSKIIIPGRGGPGTMDFHVPNGVLGGFKNLAEGDGVFVSGSGTAYDGSYVVSGIGTDPTSPVSGDNRFEVISSGAAIPAEPASAPFITNPAPTTFTLASPINVVFWMQPANDTPLHVIIPEALSGTYNALEWSSVRIFGGPAGSNDPNNSSLSAKSQDANFTDATGATPAAMPAQVRALPCWYPGRDGVTTGDRTRAIGTSEMINGSNGGGILATTDSIGYTFFSFSNLSRIAKSANYGYLKLDNVDPIFDNYSGGDPGQPATAGAEWGELPACKPVENGTLGAGCGPSDIWTGGYSFPNLRDGTYRAWALLRAICDAAQRGCLNSTVTISAVAAGTGVYTYTPASGSPLEAGESITIKGMTSAANNGLFVITAVGPATFTTNNSASVGEAGSAGLGVYSGGLEGLIAKVQDDIHFGRGIADFLPFSEDGSFGSDCVAGTPCQGDAEYMRSHFVPQDEYENEYAGSIVSFINANPSQPNIPVPQLAIEAGGDVGGCIIPISGESTPATNNTYTAPANLVPGTLLSNPVIPADAAWPALIGLPSLQCHQ